MKLTAHLVVGLAAIFFYQSCIHTPSAPVARTFASVNAMTSEARYNFFSEELERIENESFDAAEGAVLDDEGLADIGLDSTDDPPVVEDIAGNETKLKELQTAVINNVKGSGNWGIEFIYIDPKGKESVLSQYNIHQALVPASTNKLFSGYIAYDKGSYDKNSLASMLHVSNNKMAEATLQSVSKKVSGAPLQIMKTFYSGLEDFNKYSPVDGSGLSHANRVTARLEVSLLKKIYKDSNYREFKNMLGHPGDACSYDIKKYETSDDGGKIHSKKYHSTMSSRLHELGMRLHAKTGTLPSKGIKSLAGFVDVPTNQGTGTIIFSVLANNVWIDDNRALNSGLTFNKIASIVKLHTDYIDANTQ